MNNNVKSKTMKNKLWLATLIYLIVNLVVVIAYFDVMVIRTYNGSIGWWMFVILALVPFHFVGVAILHSAIDSIRKGEID